MPPFRRTAAPSRSLVRGRLAAVLALLLCLLGVTPAAGQESVGAGPVRVFFWPGQRALAEEVLATATLPLEMPGFGTVTAPDSTRIFVAPDAARFRELTGGRAPEWAGAVAFPQARVIVLPGYPVPGVDRTPAVTIRHEIAHLVTNARLPQPVPRWFDEGMAELASGSWDVESAWKLRLAIALGRAPALDSLALGWPVGAERARLAYLLSATAVQHVAERGGERGFRLLLRNWQRDGSLDASVRSTFGMTMGQLEDEWRAAVRSRYGWLQGLAASGLVWMVAAALVLLAWIPRRRRNRTKMDEMKAEERMLPPPRADGVDVEYPIA